MMLCRSTASMSYGLSVPHNMPPLPWVCCSRTPSMDLSLLFVVLHSYCVDATFGSLPQSRAVVASLLGSRTPGIRLVALCSVVVVLDSYPIAGAIGLLHSLTWSLILSKVAASTGLSLPWVCHRFLQCVSSLAPLMPRYDLMVLQLRCGIAMFLFAPFSCRLHGLTSASRRRHIHT